MKIPKSEIRNPKGGRNAVLEAGRGQSAVSGALAESQRRVVAFRPSDFFRASGFGLRVFRQEGVALVVTLILLSVITFMAIAFLFLTRTERGSVSNTTEQNIAKLAAENAQNQAIARIIADIMASHEWNYRLMVSTNYKSSVGFDPNPILPSLPYPNPTNVNYEFERPATVTSPWPSGPPLKTTEWLMNIANLQYAPRPPVFIGTNANQKVGLDFRYYLDLNRNGRFETNGWLPVISGDPANPFYNATNGALMPNFIFPISATNYLTGDPEWVGDLQYPDRTHGPNNLFIDRWAYLVTPAGQTIDINYGHNYSQVAGWANLSMNGADCFLRNQGVGTWEQNFASLLVDVNSNAWPYGVDTALGQHYTYNPTLFLDHQAHAGNQGSSFQDAVALLRYRYSQNVRAPNLGFQNIGQLFGASAATAFALDNVDDFSVGPIMTNAVWPPLGSLDSDRNLVNGQRGWSGSPNTNHFFTTQELFDKSKTRIGVTSGYDFTDRLTMLGTSNDCSSRYVFYNILKSLGTDSAPESQTKLNLNYKNVDDNGNIVPNAVTNFISWTNALQFFTNAAVRLLKDQGYSVGVGATNMLVPNTIGGLEGIHIQIYPTNYYSANVHRLMQLAANIYDATTNRIFRVPTATNGFPSVFRPIFRKYAPPGGTNTYVFITGYVEVQDAGLVQQGAPPLLDLNSAVDIGNIPTLGTIPAVEPMIYGMPVVVGAKKGYPNFNTLGMQTQVQITRRLHFSRNHTPDIQFTNEMYSLTISNSAGIEGWNSYAAAYPRPLQVLAWAEAFASFTNNSGMISVIPTNRPVSYPVSTNFATWTGFIDTKHPANGCFRIWTTNQLSMTNCYSDVLGQFVPPTGDYTLVSAHNQFPVPQWFLNVRTRLRFVLVDQQANRIVDYVNLDSTQGPMDLINLFANGSQCTANTYPSGTRDSMWCTNRMDGSTNILIPTYGIMNQISVSMSVNGLKANPPQDFPVDQSSQGQIDQDAVDHFYCQFPGVAGVPYSRPGFICTISNEFDTPFNPSRVLYFNNSWQANDPLVHYTVPDLVDLMGQPTDVPSLTTTAVYIPGVSPMAVNKHYRPYSGTVADTIMKDATVITGRNHPDFQGTSDDWDFPTNKFANVGLIGRVHRGTPWQTVYLKANAVGMEPLNAWLKWSGHKQIYTNNGQVISSRWPLATRPPTNYMTDAWFSHPTNDWALLDLFTTSFCDSATRGQLSINQTNLPAWSAVLAGVNVMSNLTASTFIEPAGAYDLTAVPALAQIVGAINQTRAGFAGGVFHSLGDILKTPQLTDASPYITQNSPFLNDEVFERIPQQILGLIKCDHTPRFVIYAYGQTLKPANNSLVTSGTFSGLCTNYQVTAEVATRSVVRIDGAPSNPHVVIESFNVLPAEP
ncbi:MAG: hypothetical protein C5B50_29260 [Verrucomicrobia bacterium]|nr:MAG: hypothetical protein C5B50_29260 [Verrucomicrobiota bacterium]